MLAMALLLALPFAKGPYLQELTAESVTVKVEVGVERADTVEIRSGVGAGEHVIRLGQYELSDGAKVEEAKPEDAAEEKKGDEKKPDEKKAEKP